MPFPGWSNVVVTDDLISPQGPRPDPTTECLEYGPVAIGDTSAGMWDNTWRCFYEGGLVKIENQTTLDPPITLFAFANVVHLSLTWDQQGRTFVAFVTSDQGLHLYWYDPIAEAFVVTDFGPADICFICQPDRRPIQIDLGQTEAVLVYQVGEDVFQRLQSDRWQVESSVPLDGIPALQISNLATNRAARLQLDYKRGG